MSVPAFQTLWPSVAPLAMVYSCVLSCKSPLSLYAGVTLANFQSSGTKPVANDRLSK